MFTAQPQKNRGAATTYFDEHLSHNDYYCQGEVLAEGHQTSHWIGLGAQKLGLKRGQGVTRDEFLWLTEETLQPAEPTQNIECRPRLPRALRPTREMRAPRLSLPQRLTRWADQLRQWLGQKLDMEPKQAVAEKLTPTQTLKQKPTPREQVQRAIEQLRQKNRPSRG